MHKNRHLLIAPLGLLSITAVTGVFLMSSTTYADDSVVDQVNITVPISCSLSGTGMNSHNANIVNGTYQADIGSTALKAFCNDTNGFAIYAIGYTDNEYGKTVLTNSTLGSTYDIATGTATSGNTSNWAMKLATNSSATYPITIDNSFDNYHVVPSPYAKVAHRDSGTDIGTGATGAELTSTYAAFMSQTQPAGTYSGKVKYTLVHPASEEPLQPVPCVAGKICYQPNASDAVGTMGNQSASDENNVELYASNFSRTGYGFAGWSDAYDYTTNPNANIYGPNQTITVPTGTTANGLSLYAVWIKSAGLLQSDATIACNGLTQDPNDGTADLSSVTALTDERDNNTYAIAKLADGKCWMIENLRLENTGAHNTDGALSQGYNSSFIGLADPESANFYDFTTANSLYSTDGSTAAPAITGSYTGYRFPRYNNNNTNSRQSSSSYSTDGNTYSMGNYYTWHASIADTTYYDTNNQSITSTSLCPTGWRLPRGGNKSNEANNEFWSLVVTGLNNGVNPVNYDDSTRPYYTGTAEAGTISNALRSYPNNFLYSGNFNGSSAYNRGDYGNYWSSTANLNRYSYYLRLDSSNVYPGTGYYTKYDGIAIRCTLGS